MDCNISLDKVYNAVSLSICKGWLIVTGVSFETESFSTLAVVASLLDFLLSFWLQPVIKNIIIKKLRYRITNFLSV